MRKNVNDKYRRVRGPIALEGSGINGSPTGNGATDYSLLEQNDLSESSIQALRNDPSLEYLDKTLMRNVRLGQPMCPLAAAVCLIPSDKLAQVLSEENYQIVKFFLSLDRLENPVMHKVVNLERDPVLKQLRNECADESRKFQAICSRTGGGKDTPEKTEQKAKMHAAQTKVDQRMELHREEDILILMKSFLNLNHDVVRI
jgi:hypothetical protein